jgi:nucleotide-binding universal stress UspA family protein
MTIHAMDLAPISGGAYGETPKPERPLIVVGYDGSVAGENALRYATERAGERGRVIAVHACGPGRWWFGAPSYQHTERDYRSSGESLIAGLEDRMPEGVSFEAVLTEGPAPKALADAAREQHTDEIVVGAHGSDPCKRGLGSVPLALLTQADRPIVVVSGRRDSGQ